MYPYRLGLDYWCIIRCYHDTFWQVLGDFGNDQILCYNIFVKNNAKCSIAKCYKYESGDVFLIFGI